MKLNKSNSSDNKSIAYEHLVISSYVIWQSCESTKLKHKQHFNCKKHSQQTLDVVKLCNYILISCLVLFGGVINGISSSNSSNEVNILGCASNPCIFGVCIDEINGTYSCYCIDGYTGKQCQTNWDECWSMPCLNGGTCIDGVAAYNCTCPEGFNGVNCEENLDECLSNPCQNGGTCDDRENGYVCYCVAGYAGVHCEVDVAVCNTGSGNKCHNGGQCVEGRGLDFTCDCAPGWKGRFCSIDIDDCESSPCQNGAICIDKVASYACICSVGFTGPNCEEDIQVCNDSPCKNSALCLMEEGSPVCYCVPDFHGEKCEYQYDECQIGPRCSNGGACIDGVDDFTCSCRNGFRGMFCECLQQSNGELDCNYTTTDSSIRTTSKISLTTDSTILSGVSWASSSSKVFTSTELTQLPTDMPLSVLTSTITQSVPTDGPSSTVEILDLSKSTSEEVSTEEHSTATESSIESTFDSQTTASESSSSGVSKKTTIKYRPCPPDQTTSKASTTIKSIIDTTSDSDLSSSSSSSTFHYDSTSYTPSFTTSTDSSTQSSFITTAIDEQSTSGTSTIIESSSLHSTSDTERETSSEINLSSTETATIGISSTASTTLTDGTSEIFKSTTTSGTTQQSSTADEDFTKSSRKDEQTTTSIDEKITSKTILTSSQMTSTTTIDPTVPTFVSSFQPPSTADDMFTLTPSDVANMTDCRNLKCYNGGSCVVTTEGAKCVCRFDRTDPHCRTLIKIRNAAFAGDSYLSHLIYSDNHPDFDIKPLENVLPINVELKARTRATDGLIFVALAQGPKGGHYTALFLHKGLLQFQFSCGLQTMLLSELEAPINNGNEFTIQVALDFSRNHSHCNASLRINDTLAMSGDQPTWLGAKNLGKSGKTISSVWLHLGGSPQTPVVLMSGLPNGQGFSGCLHTLRINEEQKEIFRDAYDGFGISECGSLACLANPCKNGGTCEERFLEPYENENELHNTFYRSTDMIENRWQCKCPTGYLGANCEKTICDNNPCQYGGTCVEFPASGYLCLCPIGKHGHYCEHSLDIDQPSFSGSVNGLSSYISYPVPIPLESTLDLSFKIAPATASQISLLAFVGQNGHHDEKSDHIAVSFIQGYIMLTWNLGAGSRRIFTQKPLVFQDPEDEIISYHVQVIRQGRKASLYIDGKLNVTGNSPGEVSRLDVVPTLYIGGHSAINFSSLPHDLPLHSGFQGCIYDLQLKSGSLVVPLHDTKGITGRSVGQCGTRECHRHSCHNSGACLQHGATYTCICPEGWFGTLCSQRLNPCDAANSKCAEGSTCVPLINGYECDCPIGKMGKYCEIAIKYLSDVSLNGKRSYFALSWHNHSLGYLLPRERYRQNMRINHEVDVFNYDSSSKLMARNIMEHQRKAQLLSVEFQLRPLSESGLLLFLGDLEDNEDGFISLSLNGGVIEFRIAGVQGQQLSIVRSNRILAIGEWHKIRLSQNGRRLSLWVEGSSTSNELKPNSIFYHSSNSLIYIGGLPDLSKLPFNSISGFPIPFKGCVRQFHMNGHRYVLNEQTIVDSRNIVDCDGTACGGDACDQGGHCYLDDKHNPHCKCPETAKGLHCEIPESCHVIKCKNDGKCMPNGECSCPNGWTGYFCEIATNRNSLPSFNGKSYMVIPSQRYTHKDKRNGASSSSRLTSNKFLQISLNFSTINVDGMLLWNDNNNNKYLGIGLENGFLKVISNLMSFKDDKIDVPMGGYLTDGAWHNVKLDIDDLGQVSIVVDRKVVYNDVRNVDDVVNNLDLLGESFYLGEDYGYM
ncbi:hypothetical protein ACKWTF_011674 [Chironomus riparius]